MHKSKLTILAAALLACAAPAFAEPLPQPDRIGAPEPILREISEMMVSRQTDDRARLARLDALLAQLREPSQTRGLVQFMRAVHLKDLDRIAPAREAVEESMRLLPGYSAPLLFAAHVEAFADRPAIAADYLLRASEIDPEIVARVPAYELRNVLGRLSQQQDRRRRLRLAERMIAVDWSGDDIDLRSHLARESVFARMEAGDVDAARALVPKLVSPSDVRTLLIDNRYRALWPDLETWAGPRQGRQWPLYLSELKSRFEASNDLDAARRYAQALRAANHNETIVRAIGPLFARPLDRMRDYELLWVAPAVGDALARLGRWQEIYAMFDRAASVWPLGFDANALNVAGNRARYRVASGDAAGGLRDIELVIADAETRIGEVDGLALGSMHLQRACALEALGRGHEAVRSVGAVFAAQDSTLNALLHLCFDRHDAARAALIDGLADEDERGSVLAFVQPSDSPPMQSDYARQQQARLDALMRDPVLLRAAQRYGRVLEHSISAGAPPEAR